jgi:hypothetical protein
MGGFKGLLGLAVDSKWKGKAVIKSRPPKKRTGLTGKTVQTYIGFMTVELIQSVILLSFCSSKGYTAGTIG